MRHDHALSGDVISIKEMLCQKLEITLEAVDSFYAATTDPEHSTTSAADLRRAIKARRNRDQFLPGHLFADPAWDMLLELYAAELDQTRLAVSILCDRAAVPATTALRWISTLEKEGLIDRRGDPLDARRIFVRLSAMGVISMEGYFRATRTG